MRQRARTREEYTAAAMLIGRYYEWYGHVFAFAGVGLRHQTLLDPDTLEVVCHEEWEKRFDTFDQANRQAKYRTPKD